jgi:hypothetical protein
LAGRYEISPMRTPYYVMLVIAGALLGGWALVSGGGDRATGPRTAPVAVIAKRVEALRRLRFDHLPVAVAVSPAQARREGLADLDRSYPEARRRSDEEVLKLLGLIGPDVTLRDVSASEFSTDVAGYYDPHSGRLRTVSGAATSSRVLREMVLSHELTHALEDQRFGLSVEDTVGNDDTALARLALIEGTATSLMYRYVNRYFTREETLAGALSGAFADTAPLPAFLEAELVFPYLGGQAFVEYLLRRAGGRWTLVDLADRSRPPASSEQVLHPEKYLRVDEPRRVRLNLAGVLAGAGYRRRAAGTWGELETRELLAAAGGGGSSDAAAGWGGDRYELWSSGSCPAPCRIRDVLVMRWRWDTPRDEREFAVKLRQWLRDGLPAGAAAAVGRHGGAVTLALAPDQALARRVAATR